MKSTVRKLSNEKRSDCELAHNLSRFRTPGTTQANLVEFELRVLHFLHVAMHDLVLVTHNRLNLRRFEHDHELIRARRQERRASRPGGREHANLFDRFVEL